LYLIFTLFVYSCVWRTWHWGFPNTAHVWTRRRAIGISWGSFFDQSCQLCKGKCRVSLYYYKKRERYNTQSINQIDRHSRK
jgi:hypothetical protein